MVLGIPADFSERRLNLEFGFGMKAQEYDPSYSELFYPHALKVHAPLASLNSSN